MAVIKPIDFNSKRPIIMQFPRFTGGKFICNCLSLSRHAVPQSTEMVDHLFNYPDDYDFRLKGVMKTLPPPDKMLDWVPKYEFGESYLYGPWYFDWFKGIVKCNQYVHRLSLGEMHYFLTAHHGPTAVNTLLNIWPNAQTIILVNYEKFYDIACNLKSEEYIPIEYSTGNYCTKKFNILRGPSWPTWREFEDNLYNVNNLTNYDPEIIEEMKQYYEWYKIPTTPIPFDIDNSIFDKHSFLEAMSNLYTRLNFEDFNEELVGKFWQSYIDLHVDNTSSL